MQAFFTLGNAKMVNSISIYKNTNENGQRRLYLLPHGQREHQKHHLGGGEARPRWTPSGVGRSVMGGESRPNQEEESEVTYRNTDSDLRAATAGPGATESGDHF